MRAVFGRATHSAIVTGARLAASLFITASAMILPSVAGAYGADGHRIAGMVAERLLCAAAAREIRALGEGTDLGELGLWADRIRSQPRWRHTAPWHFMNIADDVPIDDYRSPPEGDVLQAIRMSRAQLADDGLSSARRRDALRFLVHFIVDLHQPLHVGRAEDRGGNRIDVRLGRRTLNLHRFWDTEAVTLAGLTPDEYAARLASRVRMHRDEWAGGTPRDWAAESQALRPVVYGFGRPGGQLSDRYIAEALRVTELRLAQAGVRLATTLNGVFCPHDDEDR